MGLAICVLLGAAACGTLEVGIERTTVPGNPPQETPPPTVWLTPTPHMDTWVAYSNPVFGIPLEHPITWQAVEGYGTPELGETRFAGVNGFFHISAINAESLDTAAESEAGHHLQPYGSRPIIENTQVQGQEARLILPSVDQPEGLANQAALIVRYPEPVTISDSTYQFLVLWGDMSHIRTIAQTIRFESGSTPTDTLAPPLVWVNLPPGLIYTTATGLWLVETDEQPLQVYNDLQAVLSPDGARLISYDTNRQDAWLIDRDSGEIASLTDSADRQECCFRWWSARSDMVLFSSTPTGSDYDPYNAGYLSAIDLDGQNYRILDTEHSTGPGQFAPSPDGTTIAYGGGSVGWLYRWGTGPEQFDPASYGLAGYGEVQIANPAWSPDGRRLAWILKSDIAVGGGYRAGVVIFDLESRTAQVLHQYEAQGIGWPSAPAWSPDGEWLAMGDGSPGQNAGLWVVRADGQQERHLGLGGNPVWSPDGNWLAFQSVSQNGPIEYLLANSETWQTQPLGIEYVNFGMLVDWITLNTPAAAVEAPPTPTPPVPDQAVIVPTPLPPSPTATPSPTCEYEWFLESPPAECSGEPPIYSLTVAQHFEHGLLLWREQPDYYGSQIYAFFEDGEWPQWNPNNDGWQEGWPESDPSIIPPAGLYQPVRGFGKFWREAFFLGSGSARERLGWALEAEYSLGELPMQCSFDESGPTSCFVVGPHGVIYQIYLPNNIWAVWPQ
jgi:Tol biopolymer transport system component